MTIDWLFNKVTCVHKMYIYKQNTHNCQSKFVHPAYMDLQVTICYTNTWILGSWLEFTITIGLCILVNY